MKRKEMNELLDKDIETLSESDKNDLIEKLKKAKNLKLTQNIAWILIPAIMVGAGYGIFLDKEYGVFSDTYTLDFYSAYYQTEDEKVLKRDYLTRVDDLKEYKYILQTTPWEKKQGENYYCRTCNYYDYDKDMDEERASEIINAGYSHVTDYGTRLIKSSEEITTDEDYIEKTKEGEVGVSYLQQEFSKDYKTPKKMKVFGAAISLVMSSLMAWGMALIPNREFEDLKNKLKDLGYTPKKKSLIKKRKNNK